jgi:hypothetical protein
MAKRISANPENKRMQSESISRLSQLRHFAAGLCFYQWSKGTAPPGLPYNWPKF